MILHALCVSPPCAYALQVCDDYGHCIDVAKLSAQAKTRSAPRIIALYGAFNEILLALGAERCIVARTAADSHMPAIAALPAVGTHMRPNAELVAALDPDVILQMSGRNEALLQTGQLRGLGFPVLAFDIHDFPQLFAVTQKLGQITGREQEAGLLIDSWRKRLEAVAASVAKEAKPRVYYEAREPNLLAAGQKSIVNAIIEAAGCENVVKTSKKLARFNEEALLLANPDICIVQKGPMNPAPRPLAQRLNLRELACVRNGRVFEVDEKIFARPGPGSIDAAEKLAEMIRRKN